MVKVGVLIAVVALVVVALGWLLQRRLIYLPRDTRVPAVDDVLRQARDVTFRTADGLELGGWFLPARGARAAPAVLIFNGNAGSRALRAPLAETLRDAGLSVLLFDYRGYGGNPGRPSERGLIADARAARAYLESLPEVDPSAVVLLGESLGAAVAVAHAVERPPAALILRSPFTSMTEAGKVHYPLLPVGWMLRDRYPSIRRIPRIDCPLLVLAGDSDQIVPAEQSRELYEAAGSEHKRWVLLRGAGHNDYDLALGRSLTTEAVSFIRLSLGQPERDVAATGQE